MKFVVYRDFTHKKGAYSAPFYLSLRLVFSLLDANTRAM